MSDEKQEITVDILREMHEGPIPRHRHDRELLHHYETRLKAALKREKAAIEADALTVGGIVEASNRRELSKNASKNGADFGQLGDAAKLREALSDACYAMFNFLKAQNGGYEEMANALDKAKAALAAPPRNCDKYPHDQALRIWSAEPENPMNGCFDVWLYAPATEKEGESDE